MSRASVAFARRFRSDRRVMLQVIHEPLKAFGFVGGAAGRLGLNALRLSVGERDASEWLRNHEAIPTLESPGPARDGDERNDLRAGALRGHECTGRERASRTARAV